VQSSRATLRTRGSGVGRTRRRTTSDRGGGAGGEPSASAWAAKEGGV
jgi:hypothetical protein